MAIETKGALNPSKIIKTVQHEMKLDQFEAAHLPSHRNLSQQINRACKGESKELVDEFKHFCGKNKFLLYDSQHGNISLKKDKKFNLILIENEFNR